MTTDKKLQLFFEKISNLQSEEFMKLVEDSLTDSQVEIFVDHIEDYYGIEDDEELGTLAQLMITGYLAGLEKSSNSLH